MHIKKENIVMKYLKIENSKGEYYNGTEYKPLDKLSNEDLWYLARMAVTAEDFELEAYNEDSVKNKAHQIIYQQVYSQLNNLFSRKAELKSQCESIYKEAYDKYKM